MIRVYLKNFVLEDEIVITNEKREVEIKVCVHSGFDIKGSDIVCSAVSVIIHTSILAITRVEKIHQKVIQEDGFLKSSIYIKDVRSAGLFTLKVILNTMIIGLYEIKDHFPGTLDITFE